MHICFGRYLICLFVVGDILVLYWGIFVVFIGSEKLKENMEC